MLTREETLRYIQELNPPTERAQLAQAAIALASGQSAEGIAELRKRLKTTEFLARLDAIEEPQRKTYFLSRAFAALELNPSPATEALAISVANSPEFTADPIRLNYLLPALAAVRPMGEEAAGIFRRTNTEGYFSVNAPLMTRNGSPVALRLFEEMMRSAIKGPESRIDALHNSVLPYRTEVPILEMCRDLLSGGLEPEVEVGVIETLFDYQLKRWFGPERVVPRPQPWDAASPEAIQLARQLATSASTRTDLPVTTREAVNDFLKWTA